MSKIFSPRKDVSDEIVWYKQSLKLPPSRSFCISDFHYTHEHKILSYNNQGKGAVTPRRSYQRFLTFEETLVVAPGRWHGARRALCELSERRGSPGIGGECWSKKKRS